MHYCSCGKMRSLCFGERMWVKIGKQTCVSLNNVHAIRLMCNIQMDLVPKIKVLFASNHFGYSMAGMLRMKLGIPVILGFTESE